MSDNHDVLRFHQRLGLPVRDEPTVLPYKEMMDRVRFLEEELTEMKESIKALYAADDFPVTDNYIVKHLAGIFDALIDLVYVAHGTAIQMGLPWQQGWDRVQDANMQKQRGPQGDGHKIGVIKPEGWQAPDIAACILYYYCVIDGFKNTYGESLRCSHGLHKISDVCPDCENAAIMGIKPSSRGAKSGGETT